MKADVHTFVKECLWYQADLPTPYASLFKVAVAPKWSSYIVEYLTHKTLPLHLGRARRKSIEIEAQDYVLIQLYKRGKYQQLRLCIAEQEYVPILQQAHSGLVGGYFLAIRLLEQ